MNKLDKILVLAIVTINMLLTSAVYGQQDVQYTQNMFNLAGVNPGYVGVGNEIIITTIQREQWTGLKGGGNPSTTMLSAQSPFNLFGKKHGLGIEVTNDNIGFTGTFNAKFSYSYKINILSGEVGIGLNAGILNYQLKNTNWKPVDAGDIAIPSGDERDMALDLGLGLFYTNGLLYAGFSAAHINTPQLKFTDINGPRIRPNFYFTGGYNFRLGNPLYELQPSVFVLSDGTSFQFNTNVNFVYNKKFWGGVSYRVSDALSVLVGLELFNGIKIGYAYDISTSKLGQYNNGSHEVLLSYGFSIISEKIPTKFKSIRLL